MIYFWLIIALLFALGYTYYKFNQLKNATKYAFAQLQEGLQKIINDDGSELFGENFQRTLTAAIHGAMEEMFGINYDILDDLQNVNLAIRIHWNSKQDMTMFDFSQYEKDKSKGVVGIEIWTTLNTPPAFAQMGIAPEDTPTLFYESATLLWVKNKEEETDSNAYWIWPEQDFFVATVHEGELFEEDEEEF